MASNANYERIAGIYFRFAAHAERSNYSGNVIKHRKQNGPHQDGTANTNCGPIKIKNPKAQAATRVIDGTF
jgi:hypothetical protein